jgi:hypothetical protein
MGDRDQRALGPPHRTVLRLLLLDLPLIHIRSFRNLGLQH